MLVAELSAYQTQSGVKGLGCRVTFDILRAVLCVEVVG